MLDVTGTTEVLTLTKQNANVIPARVSTGTTVTNEVTVSLANVNPSRVSTGTTVTNEVTASLANVGVIDVISASFTIENNFGPFGEGTALIDSTELSSSLSVGTMLSLLDNGFGISENLSVVWTPVPLEDSFTIQDTQELSNTAYLESIVSLVDSFGSIHQATALISTLGVRDSQELSFIALLTDSFNVSNFSEISTLANLISQFNVSDSVNHTLSVTQSLTGYLNVGDSQAIGLAELLASTGLFTDSITDLNSQIELLTGSLTITDVQLLSATVLENVIGSLTLSEQITFGSNVHNVVLVSTVEMGNIIWSPDYGAIAWVMNTESSSIAPYTNFGFHSLAEHKGRVFAASPAGIFELVGDTDAGRKIDARIQQGFQDFGIPERKRVSDLYMSYTGGSLECSIETYDGPKTVYNYVCEEREAEAPRNNRMKVGRGLVSRYWRTEIHNLEGASFKVYETALNIATTKRRL